MSAVWFLSDGGGSAAWATSDVAAVEVTPAVPSLLASDGTSESTATLTWVSNGGLGFDVQIEVPLSSANWVAAAGATNPTAQGVQSFSVTGLTGATDFGWRLRSKGPTLNSAYVVGPAFGTDNVVGGGGTVPPPPGVTVAPAVSLQPSSVSLVVGNVATFTASFTGTPTPTRQWYRNGVLIAGATGVSYSFTPTLLDTGATFYSRATNSAGAINSNTVTLTVTEPSVVLPGSDAYVITIPDKTGPRETLALVRSRGDTYGDEFLIRSAATGLPINLTGCSFLMTLDPEQAPATNTNNVFQLTGSVLDAATGSVEFAPSAGQADLVGSYFFDIQMTDAVGRKRTIKYGTYTFKQDITKT